MTNLGSGPANNLRIQVEPVGDGASPIVLDSRNGDGLLVERLLDHTYMDSPIALSMGTVPQAKLTLTWEEDGARFAEEQSIRWM
ncbi:hypothetical protein ACFY8E_10220 [Streptomyces albidoflavus]|uniref:hypothetical protein n=1 Tax=Streptomyces albidoflavus TaxID=1886 RepID=UPI003689FFA5